ncbi:MAG: DNA-binding response regulator, partial [Bacteroidota bacterium]
IEDNKQIVQILSSLLGDFYNIKVAFDGAEGIEKALQIVPDLILSDVMMPNKNGYEVCHKLKTDERTSHIPIVLLTAKSDIKSKITGLKKSADAYLTKPFNEHELVLVLRNLLELRKKMQSRYLALSPESKVDEAPEDAFLLKVRKAIMDHIDDEEFGIIQLCRAIGLSRAQLHNKLKALTGLSTSIYVRSIKLNHAKHLLDTTQMNISEIAYAVGFKSVSYFSSTYQKEFGQSPSKARTQQ